MIAAVSKTDIIILYATRPDALKPSHLGRDPWAPGR